MRRFHFLLALLALGCSRKQTGSSVPDAAAPLVATAATVALVVDPADGSSGPLAWASWNGTRVLLLADEDDRSLRTLDASSLALLGRRELSGAPSAIHVAAGRVFVALRDVDQVVELTARADEVGAFDIARSLRTGSEPVALATAAEELLVVTAFGHSLERFVLHGAAVAPLRVTTLAREPRSLVVLADGTVAVGHASVGPLSLVRGDQVDTMDLDEHDVCLSDASTEQVCIDQSTLLASQHVALAAFEDRIVSAGSLSLVVEDGLAEAQSSYGTRVKGVDSTVLLSLDLLDPSKKSADASLPQPSEAQAAAKRGWGDATGGVGGREHGLCSLPRAVVVDAPRSEILVACLGSDRVTRFTLKKGKKGWLVADAPRPTLTVAGGPTALARHEASVVVFAREARTLTSFAFDAKNQPIPGASVTVPIAKPLDAIWQHGRALFHSSQRSISAHGLSCAHCHPDGRDDDIVWATPRGKRRSLTLAGVGSSGLGWDAQSKTFAAHLQATLARIGGAGLGRADSSALESYVTSLRVPHLPSAADVPPAFVKAGCAPCHERANGFSDGKMHDLGKRVHQRTPRLIGLGGRRSFFHDGRYPSLAALVNDEAAAMGQAGALGDAERAELLTFLQSL